MKAGIADSIQDEGRFGFQHLGINPNGAMDQTAMKIANALVGNDLREPVVELSFPASSIQFEKTALISLSGADFSAMLNGAAVGNNKALIINRGDELKFKKSLLGSFAYLAVHGGLRIAQWLGSASTNTKAKAGGWQGRFLKKGDEIEFIKDLSRLGETRALSWRVNVSDFYSGNNIIRCVEGREWTDLEKVSQDQFKKKPFIITQHSDRMGYRLKGPALKRKNKTELISSAVTFGTVQLFPDGQLIILMADHQTTGGYPRVAQVITADRSNLVQLKQGDEILFSMCSLAEAEKALVYQAKVLQQIKTACAFNLREIL